MVLELAPGPITATTRNGESVESPVVCGVVSAAACRVARFSCTRSGGRLPRLEESTMAGTIRSQDAAAMDMLLSMKGGVTMDDG